MEIAIVWAASIIGIGIIAVAHRLPVVRWVVLGVLLGPAAAVAAAIEGADITYRDHSRASSGQVDSESIDKDPGQQE